MILYHISKDLQHDGVFEPRVPENRLFKEDDYTERVCLSKTIEGCFSSMPGGGDQLEDTNAAQFGLYRLFVVDTEKYDILSHEIYDSHELVTCHGVADAYLTDEVWVTKSFSVQKEDTHWLWLYRFGRRDVNSFPLAYYRDTRTTRGSESFEAYMRWSGGKQPHRHSIVDEVNVFYDKATCPLWHEIHVPDEDEGKRFDELFEDVEGMTNLLWDEHERANLDIEEGADMRTFYEGVAAILAARKGEQEREKNPSRKKQASRVL